jgi:hypothetical protein
MFRGIIAFVIRLFSRPKAAEPPGATEQYGVELHQIGEMERYMDSVAQELGVDPLADAELIEEVVALRLSMAERLAHFAGRWEREVTPLIRRLGDLTADTFEDVLGQVGVFVMPDREIDWNATREFPAVLA